MYLQEGVIWPVIGMVLFIIAAITDYLDGYFARRYEVTSSLGRFLDPLADKILTFAGFICIPFIDASQFPWWIIGIIVFRDIFITGLRLWSEKQGWAMQTLYSAKIKTTVQMVFLYLILLTGIFAEAGGIAGDAARMLLSTGIPGILFVIVMIVTVYTALEYIYINRRLFIRGPKNL